MSFIEKSKAQQIAERVDKINLETISFLRSQMEEVETLLNTPEHEGDIISVFGKNAGKVLDFYESIVSSLDSVGRKGNLKMTDGKKFKRNPDGKVEFIKPDKPDKP